MGLKMLFIILFFPKTIFSRPILTEFSRNVQNLINRRSEKVLVAAHRGNWRQAPENSIEAIEFAIKLGADIIEVDVRETSDGEFILMHDEDLDRVTNGTGFVNETTLEEIRTFHLRNGLDRLTEFKIPTLEEALNASKGKALLNLDKVGGFIDKMYPILNETGTLDQTIIKSSEKYEIVYEKYKNVLDDIIFMPIISDEFPDFLDHLKTYKEKMNPVAYEFVITSNDSALLDPKLVKEISKSAHIWVNTLWASLCAGHDDDRALKYPEATWGWVIDKGAQIMQTDRPRQLIEFLKKRKSPDNLETVRKPNGEIEVL